MGPGLDIQKLRTWAGFALLVIFFAWLFSGALATWKLTHRRSPLRSEERPEPSLGAERVRFATSDGEELGAWYAEGPSEHTVAVLLHGSGETRASSGQVALFHELRRAGHGVLSITLRGHGDSTGEAIDFGWSSRFDVLAAVDFLEQRAPGTPIVIIGRSLGAAATLFAAPNLGDRVAGYLFEAPYRDVVSATKARLRLRLPPIVSGAAYLGLRLWAPLFMEKSPGDLRPIEFVDELSSGARVVFLVGAEDRHSPPHEVREMADLCTGETRFISMPGARHESLFFADRDLYMGVLAGVLSGTIRAEEADAAQLAAEAALEQSESAGAKTDG